MTLNTNPPKWHTVYRGSEDKCFFCGKDGKSGLARSEYDWRTTDSLSRESGLTKKRTEEIIDFYCKKGLVVQHAKDPEKWGYWERVGTLKGDPDPLKKDHDDRIAKQQNANGGVAKKSSTGTSLPGGSGTTTTPVPAKLPKTIPAPPTGGSGKSSTPATKPVVKAPSTPATPTKLVPTPTKAAPKKCSGCP